MAFRCTEEEVRALMESDEDVRVAPFITTANLVVDDVSSHDSSGLLSPTKLKEIEKYLAAHFYEHHDQALAEEKTGDASGAYQGEWGKGFDGSTWGQSAKLLDTTGYLASLDKGRRRVGLSWGGLPTSEQSSFEERNR